MLVQFESQSSENAQLLPVVSALAEDLKQTRETLADEMQKAMERALELHAMVPPGISWTGELDLSASLPSASPSPRL